MFRSLIIAGVSALAVLASPIEKRNYGVATYYYQNGNPGACGNWNGDDAYIVALDTDAYGGGSYCGQQVTLVNADTGATVVATVADECPSCGSFGNIDTSVAVFNVLSNYNLDQGVANVNWWFNN